MNQQPFGHRTTYFDEGHTAEELQTKHLHKREPISWGVPYILAWALPPFTLFRFLTKMRLSVRFGAICACFLLFLGSFSSIRAAAQFLTDFELANSPCYDISSSVVEGGHPFHSSKILVEEFTKLPLQVAVFAGNDRRQYELNCFYIVDQPPPDLPAHLASTCASEGNKLQMWRRVAEKKNKESKNYTLVGSLNYYNSKPLTQTVWGGRSEPLATVYIDWAPAKQYVSPACYPRYVTVTYCVGLSPEQSNSITAYIIIGVIAGVIGLAVIAIFAYLLHRRMSTFMLRGQLGAQKSGAERYGPGDEDPEATRQAEGERHRREMLQYAKEYAMAEVEVERGVFVSRRIDLYRDEGASGAGPEGLYAGDRPTAPEGLNDDSAAYGGAPALNPYGQQHMSPNPPRPGHYGADAFSAAGSPSPMRDGAVPMPGHGGVPTTRPPAAGQQSAIIDVPLYAGAAGAAGPTVPVQVTSAPLNKPWYEQFAAGHGNGRAPPSVAADIIVASPARPNPPPPLAPTPARQPQNPSHQQYYDNGDIAVANRNRPPTAYPTGGGYSPQTAPVQRRSGSEMLRGAAYPSQAPHHSASPQQYASLSAAAGAYGRQYGGQYAPGQGQFEAPPDRI